jgi:hypothetical protein
MTFRGCQVKSSFSVVARQVRVAALCRVHATRKGIRVLERGRARRIRYLTKRLRILTADERATPKKATEILERVLRNAH